MAGRPKAKRAIDAAAEPLVNQYARAQGNYQDAKIVDLTGELGGKRQAIVKVLLNKGGTAVERWRSVFSEQEWRAIGHCQALWHKAGGSGSLVMDPLKVIGLPGGEGWSQHEALTDLSTIKGWFPREYFEVFENVCRFDEPAGVAGSRLASNSRSAIDKAQMCVRMVAGVIAVRLGL